MNYREPEIASFAVTKMKKLGLWQKGWRYTENNRVVTDRFGRCYLTKKVIEYCPKPHIGQPESEKYDTVVHEIAHAMEYMHRDNARANGITDLGGHGEHWKQWCRILGCKPEQKGPAFSDELVNKVIEARRKRVKYHVYCPNHGIVATAKRLTEKKKYEEYTCKMCGAYCGGWVKCK